MKRFAKLTLVSLILLTGFVLLRGTAPQVATGTWQSGSEMSEARTGAAAVTLDDGRVLVFGGTTSSGGATNAVQVFSDGSWSDLGAVMLDPRSGHSATALADGRILLAGGENSSGPLSSLEIYDPASSSFSSAGTLSGARKSHGAARLPGGSVLMIGGSDGTNALASSEIFDPESGSVSAGPSLSAPRTGLSVTRLLDGKVLIAGGNNGEADLASTLIYNPADGSFSAGADLSAPRSGHSAVLLPNNNSVLISGGSGLASAELYIPWTGSVSATASMASARNGAAGSGSGWDGIALVAGGSGSASSELYGFATVKTDDDDYAPGQTVYITGSGWQPGETVTLVLHEIADFHGDRTLTAVADAFGNIANSEYSPEDHDFGVRFYLTATGAQSQAQTTFTDGQPQVTSVSNPAFSPTSSLGVKDTTDLVARNQGGGSLTNVRIRIRAGTLLSGTLVREFTVTPSPLGANSNANAVTWDGKDTGGFFVAEGTYTARALANSVSENDGPSDKKTIIVDNTVPAAPSTPDLHQGSDSNINNDDITNDNTPRFDGTAETDSTVEVFAGFTSEGTATAGGGTWSIPQANALADGVYSITAKTTDAAGNTSGSSGALSITIDTLAPNTSIDSNPSNPSGSTSASFTFSGTDADSVLTFECKLDAAAFAPCTSPQNYSGLATGSHTFQVRATDRAGNTDASPASFTWSIVTDSTPPVITPNVVGTLGSNGWYTSNVDVSFTVTDPDSTISSQSAACTITTTISTDTTGQTVTCTATSAGGTSSESVTIKRDATAPLISCGAADVSWHANDVSIACTADGSVSGLADAGDASFNLTTSVPANTEDPNASTDSRTVFDNAGNSATAGPISGNMVDKKGPTLSCASPDTAWHATNQSFACTASDGGSGLDVPADASFSLSTNVAAGDETDNAFTGSHEVCDDIGNCDTAGPIGPVKVDRKAPQLTACDSADGFWHPDNVTLYCTYSDGGSGPASQQVDLNTNIADGFETANAAASAGGDQACDAVNNCADSPADIPDNMIDRKDPTITLLSRLPAANGFGWNNSAVTVKWTCTDGGSGPAASPVMDTKSLEGASQTAYGTCTDNVGNSASASLGGINIDLTNPTLNPSVSPNPVVLNGSATASSGAADALSGIDTQSCGAVDTSSVGSHSVNCTATDKAGNTANASANYTVQFGVCVLYDQSKSHKKGSTVPVKLYLCDASGNDVSSLSTVVTATGLTKIDNNASALVEDSGQANSPDNNFRFDLSLGPSGGYIFNLSTKNLSTGTWKLAFTATGDAVTHYVQFDVK